ncbi:hypothetical protein MPSEU_000427700 [Mayamaea pseudoterrestris]|nr:hypothetical protein MPSEU_000427700 [Mayamaea pseudoterrestris]
MSFAGGNPAKTSQTPATTGATFSSGAPASGPASAGAAPPAFGSTSAAPATPGVLDSATATSSSGGLTAGSASNLLFAGAAAPSATGGLSSSNNTTATRPPTMIVPDYETLFTGQALWDVLKPLTVAALDASDKLSGQELKHLVVATHKDKLLNPPILQETQPNMQLRQQLMQHPTVLYQNNEATLTMPMLHQVFALSDDLRISEQAALCLYAKASPLASRRNILNALDPQTMDYLKLNLHHDGDNDVNREGLEIGQVARALYLFDLKLHLRTLLLLFQCRLQDASGCIVLATDKLLQLGLVHSLVTVVREYTGLTGHMQDAFGRVPFSAKTFLPVLINFCAGERLAAALILYFVAYHCQMEGREVAVMIDLVRDLSNNQPILDPFDENFVPSAVQSPIDFAMGTSWSQQSAQREKDPVAWKDELVNRVCHTGLHHLLRCTGVCVMAVLAALDAQSELSDRTSHSTNPFGSGNALLPPNSTDTTNLLFFHDKLTLRVEKDWQRPDIFGLLLAGYSLLLRRSPAALASPRMGPTSPRGATAIDIRKAWKEGIQAPTQLKSITYARLCLIPALRMPKDDLLPNCIPSEFLLSTLAGFTSQFFDQILCTGGAPISRRKWDQDAKEALRLNAKYQEEQKSFQSWAGTSAVIYEQLPTSVDPLDRPDCMDDVVAFATTVCSLGANYASPFWLQTEETRAGDDGGMNATRFRLEASQALLALGLQQSEDGSLRPAYLSFLAALASVDDECFVESGASCIYQLLSDGPDAIESWTSLFQVPRYFIQELDLRSGHGAPIVRSDSTNATSYYYDDSGLNVPHSVAFGSSRGMEKVFQARELGEDNTYLVMSVMRLITNVARHSVSGRLGLLGMPIPVQESRGRHLTGCDSALMVLFTFACQPLSPELRGAVFSAIAALLCVNRATAQEMTKLHEYGLSAWDMLDACQVVPIFHLDQYTTGHQSSRDADLMTGLAFPPSSLSMAITRHGKSWIPPNTLYSIIYELEYVETNLGVYFSTEGLLRLLRSLFESAGSPSHVGGSYRSRTGCTPYIEYVINYVLRRAVGCFDESQEPIRFNSLVAKRRLITLALEVADTVLTQYYVSDALKKDEASANMNLVKRCNMLRIPASVHALATQPFAEDSDLFIRDFNPSGFESISPEDLATCQSTHKLPRVASPGLVVLLGMLLTNGGALFESIVITITDVEIDGATADRASLTYAAFCATPPTIASSKALSRASSKKMLLMTLLTPLEAETSDSMRYWNERCTVAALHLCCAAVLREKDLVLVVESMPRTMTLVPVLSFNEIGPRHSALETVDLQVSRMTSLLLRSDVRTGIISRIIDLVGYVSQNDEYEVEIAAMATILVTCAEEPFSFSWVIGDVSGSAGGRLFSLSKAFGRRLLRSACRSSFRDGDYEAIGLVLESLVTNLRNFQSDASSPLMFALLGVHNLGAAQELMSDGACFDAILRMVKQNLLIQSSETSYMAALCYEVIFRMYQIALQIRDNSLSEVVAEKLRSVDVLRCSLKRLTDVYVESVMTGNENVTHSIAWVVKCLALEVRFAGESHLRMHSFNELLSFLFEPPNGMLCKIVRCIPIKKLQLKPGGVAMSEESIRAAKIQLPGALEVVRGYEIIDGDCLMGKIVGGDDTKESLKSWTDQWNLFIRRDCSSAHITSAIHTILTAVNVVENFWSIQTFSFIEFSGCMLFEILEKLAFASNDGLDHNFYTTATRNFALMALQAVAAMGRGRCCSDNIIFRYLARVIASSGWSRYRNGVGESRKHERTIIFATVLCLLLDADAMNFNLPGGEDVDWTDTTRVLACMACLSTASVYNEYASIASACLVYILDLNANRENFLLATFFADMDQCQKRHSIHLMVESMARLDRAPVGVLQEIVLLPDGAKLLHQFKVLDKIETAAENYKNSVVASPGDTNETELIAGHMDILTALMLEETDDVGRLNDTALRALHVLRLYVPVLQPFLSNFPFKGDTLRATFRCLTLARMIRRDNENLVPQLSMIQAPPDDQLMQFQVASTALLMHMAEYPLPRHLMHPLPPLPSCVSGISRDAPPVFDGKKCWWDGVSVQLSSNDEILEYAGLGAETLKIGLAALDERSWPALSDADQIARAICRCVEAIRVLERMGTTNTLVPCSDDKANLLRSNLADALELLIVACMRLVQQIHNRDYNPSQSEKIPHVLKTFRLTLDMCRLDTEGIQPMIPSQGDENLSQATSLKDLAYAFRKVVLP